MAVDLSQSTRRTLGKEAEENVLHIVFIIILWLGVSYGLIASNKHLMTQGFPYAAFLGLVHSITCFLLTAVLYISKPSLFTFLGAMENREKLRPAIFGRAILPIAICFSLEIIFSNQAYMHSSVAFLQMLKELNVVLVYVMGLLFGLEAFSWLHFKVIVLIVIASMGTIRGELHLTAMGFGLQLMACIVTSVKLTMQGVLLSTAGFKLDPLSYVLLVMPACALTFSSSLMTTREVGHEAAEMLPIPSWAVLAHHWHLLIPNALLAFTLNVVAAWFIKISSCTTYCLVGFLKDGVIVLGGVLLQGEQVGCFQALAFSCQMGLLVLWSIARQDPELFQQGFLTGMRSLCSKRSIAEPSVPEVMESTSVPALAESHLREQTGHQDYGAAASIPAALPKDRPTVEHQRLINCL